MKRAYWILLTIGLLGALATTAIAAVPDFVNYSGRLTDGTGAGQSTTADLTFRIYDCGCPPGGDCAKPCETWPGDPIYEKPFPATPIEDGYFNVILTGVADVFGAHDQTWITVCAGVDCGQELDLLPRQAVGSVPYAMRAARLVMEYGAHKMAANGLFRGSTVNKSICSGTGCSFLPGGKTTGAIAVPGYPLGYRSAKRACEIALDSPTAHMCSASEMTASAQLGVDFGAIDAGYAWFSSGASSAGKLPDIDLIQDCEGWKIGQNQIDGNKFGGTVWHTGGPIHDPCGSQYAVACCDF